MHAKRISFAVALALALAGPAQAQAPLGVELVDAINALSGRHPGYRATHAKGAMFDGSFTPSAEARALSRAPQFQASLPVLVRFSDSTGVPNIPDGAANANPRGMAIRFVTPDARPNDVVAHAVEGFPSRTGEEFRDFLRAIAQSPPGTAQPTPLERFLGSHPAALRFVQLPNPTPRSFASAAFFGLNALLLVAPDGSRQAVRYTLQPEGGTAFLEAAAAAAMPPDFLFAELATRLAAGPVRFSLVAQLAGPGDATNDITQAWPAERRRVVLGIVSITRARPDSDALQRATNFDPTNIVEGVELSDDPLLLARREAYGVSIARRQ